MRQPADTTAGPGDALRPRLRRRADFLHVAKGQRSHTRPFSLQTALRREVEDTPARFGFTVTKKVGGAVERNRIRRRLKEAVRLAPDLPLLPGNDYVIVGRREALGVPFLTLQTELRRAVATVHRTPRATQRRERPGAATTTGAV